MAVRMRSSVAFLSGPGFGIRLWFGGHLRKIFGLLIDAAEQQLSGMPLNGVDMRLSTVVSSPAETGGREQARPPCWVAPTP